jgi:aconitase A
VRRGRADTRESPKEVEYFKHGGILQYVLRGLLASSNASIVT